MSRTMRRSMLAVAVIAAGVLGGSGLYAQEAAPGGATPGQQTAPGGMMGHNSMMGQNDQMMGMMTQMMQSCTNMMQAMAPAQPQPDKG